MQDVTVVRAVGDEWVDDWDGRVPLLFHDDHYHEAFLAVNPTKLKAATWSRAWSELPDAIVPGDEDEMATGGEQE